MVLATGYAAFPAAVGGERVTLRLPAPTDVRPWLQLPVAGSTVRRPLPGGRGAAPGGAGRLARLLAARARAAGPRCATTPSSARAAQTSTSSQAEDGALSVRTWERGFEGETLSCGSGVVAAALVGVAERWIAAPASVRTASGRVLLVEPEGSPPSCPARLSGPAEWVAEGTVHPELLR